MLFERQHPDTLSSPSAISTLSDIDDKVIPSRGCYSTPEYEGPEDRFMFNPSFYSSNLPLPYQYNPFDPQRCEDFGLQSDHYPNTVSSAGSGWQLRGDSYWNPGLLSPASVSSHTSQGAHRRNLSNSTIASTDSAFAFPATASYSASSDNTIQELDTCYDSHHGPIRFKEHLPTPTLTPTQEYFMDRRNGRRRKAEAADNAAHAAHMNLRQAMGRPSLESQSSFGQDNLRIPQTLNGDGRDEQYGAQASAPVIRQVPKFDRTMSDIYQDELYNPASVATTSAPAQRQSIHNPSLLSPYRNVVSERLQAANNARSMPFGASGSRDPSPFRQGSPFAASSADFGTSQGRIGTAAGQREQQKAEADAIAYQQHHPPPEDEDEPPTISPKEAMLDYHGSAEAAQSLFPETPNSSQSAQRYEVGNSRPNPVAYSLPLTNFGFVPPSMPAIAQAPGMNDFKFMPPPLRRPTTAGSEYEQSLEFPARLVTMETTKSEQDTDSPHSGNVKPAATTADTGTYSCTYHGCAQRFDSATKLQKHKREGHRSTVAASVQPPATPTGATATPVKDSQAGPHRCDRINPSTGKPCNTVFSRPYDLTRHEDTIHSGMKKKVRCNLCPDDKSFSRNDALTRHMRVVHPDVDFPGKHRRRQPS